MSNFIMLVACLLLGLALRQSGRIKADAHLTLNTIILHVSLPAVTLRHLHDFSFEALHVWPVLMPWALFLLGAILFWALGRAMRVPAATVGALILVAGLGNTSFVGLPMIEALHGRDGLGLGLVIDQLGSYLALSTLGVAIAAVCAARGRLSARDMALKVCSFPPFVALVAALLLSPVSFPPLLNDALSRIGETLAPLALLSVGMQLRFDALREHGRMLFVGLCYKLLICPGLVVMLLWLMDVEGGPVSSVSVIEAAMPPMIGAAVVATQYNLAPRLAAMLVGLGIPVGLFTASAWFWAFGALTR